MGLISGYGDEDEKFSKLKHVRHVMRAYAFLSSEVVGRLDICPGGGGTPHMKGMGILVVPLRGVTFRFWSHLIRVFWAKRRHI